MYLVLYSDINRSDYMFITKSRLQGSSVVSILSSDNGKKFSENEEYIVVYFES